MTTETQNKRIPFSEKKEQLMRNPKFVEAYESIKDEYKEESRKIQEKSTNRNYKKYQYDEKIKN